LSASVSSSFDARRKFVLHRGRLDADELTPHAEIDNDEAAEEQQQGGATAAPNDELEALRRDRSALGELRPTLQRSFALAFACSSHSRTGFL
jgi:hypothetical protein